MKYLVSCTALIGNHHRQVRYGVNGRSNIPNAGMGCLEILEEMIAWAGIFMGFPFVGRMDY
jgi:hypothetical protein